MGDVQKDLVVADPETGKIDNKNYFDLIFNQVNYTGRAELVEPPQIEGSTVDDWLHFFLSNGVIFIVWLLAMVWVCYAVFYHSRVIGFILTKIVNYLFIKNGYFRIGSFSFASISGKIMFRDLVYVTEDYSLRVQDGLLIFCYWYPYVYRNAKTEDLSNCDPRVQFILNGFELHIYNRSETYSELEKLFNLPSKIFGDSQSSNKEKDVDLKKQADEERRQKILKTMKESATVNELKQSIWRDLIPVTKVEISSGRFVFGNSQMPSTLSISVEDFHFTYTSRPAVSRYDLFTHIVKGKAENLQVVLVPSLQYSGRYVREEPPRCMGDGFIVFRTNKIDVYYYQDEPGLITDEEVANEESADGENGNSNGNTPPAWGMVIKTGKGTDFSYGPWADRQRDYLYNFFYPPTFQVVPVSEKLKVGELRRFESLDIRLSTLYDAKIDILFSKNKETNALHLNAGPGTYLEMSIPWICGETGYTSHVLGQILHLEATTSLAFRHFVSSETLEIDLKIDYPRIWNAHQDWSCKVTACKATVDLIFAHKVFLNDLIDDWSDRNRPDILKFVPYTWRISVVIKEFELIVLANEHNWIDCSTGVNDENCKIAVCGEHFDMAFDLPFIEYLPPKLAIKIWIQGECLEGAFYLPECSINRDVVELLQRYANILCRDGSRRPYLSQFGQSRKWKKLVSRENHWYECMSAPILALSITYDYWPMPVMVPTEIKDSEVTTPELEEILISPLRAPEQGRATGGVQLLTPQQRRQTTEPEQTAANFDPTSLAPDVMTVELEIGPMSLAIFGSLLIFLWNIKENYLGESQVFSEMSASFFDEKFGDGAQPQSQQPKKTRSDTTSSEKQRTETTTTTTAEPTITDTGTTSLHLNKDTLDKPDKPFDPRLYRPFEVIVSATLHEIQGHLVQCSNQTGLYAPLVFVEKLAFELVKTYTETKLQLIISPAVVQVDDGLERKSGSGSALNSAWKEGFLTLSSLQFRGHAMFSNLDRPIESETLEYAWLVEVEVGEVGGRLTLDHLRQIVIPLENCFFQILQADVGLQAPNPFKKCLHDRLQNECSHSEVAANRLCPYSEDLKYRMVRVLVNQIDIFLLDANVAMNLVVPSVKLATCNLHIEEAIDGFSLLVTNATLRQFVTLAQVEKATTETGQREGSWLEISSVSTGPLFIDAALSSSAVDNYSVSQIDFIKKHDTATRRLWFLWSDLHRRKCGCVGNVTFFGCNLGGLDFFAFSSPAVEAEHNKPKPKPKCYGAQSHLHDHGGTVVFNPAYGESLLHPGNFLLDINSPLMDETSKAIMNTSKYTNSSSSHTVFSKIKSPSALKMSTRPSTLTVQSDKGVNSSSEGRSILETTFLASPMSGDAAPSRLHPKPSVTSSERFFSAEDLSSLALPMNMLMKSAYSNKTEMDVDSLTHTSYYRTASDNPDNRTVYSSPSSDTAWLSPTGVLSADDITSQSRYYTARGGGSTSTSNATLGKFQSLSSDSSPTLVSASADNDGDDNGSSSGSSGSLSHDGRRPSKNSFDRTLLNTSHPKKGERRSSATFSTNSFMSAVSEHEDLDLVDLRNQLEKPIFESPLLMSTYAVYMSQYVSQHLDAPPPFPLLQNARITAYFGLKSATVLHFDRLLYEYRHEWKPRFMLKKAGFSETRIVYKAAESSMDDEKFYSTHFVPGIVATKSTIQRAKDVNFLDDSEVVFLSSQTPRKPTVTFSTDHQQTPRSRAGTVVMKDDVEAGITSVSKSRAETLNVEQTTSVLSDREDAIENVQVYIQFREVEVKVSPLTLDVLAKFVTSTEEMVASLHPGSLLNHLSLTCQNAVEGKNLLKKEKRLYLGQLHMRAWKVLKQRQSAKHLNRSISFSTSNSGSSSDRGHSKAATAIPHETTANSPNTLVSKSLEVDRKVSVSVNIEVSRINVHSLQASIVEEVISFSALDRVQDLTAVSVLNLSLSKMECRLVRTYRRRSRLQVAMEQSSVSSLSFTEKALMTRFFTRKPKKVYSEIEMAAYETTDAFVDEMVTNVGMSTVHLQLSRLINSPDVLRGATLTVIPFAKTKVDFVYTGPNPEEYDSGDMMKQKRRKYIKSVMQNSASSTSRKGALLTSRQSVVLPSEVNVEGETLKQHQTEELMKESSTSEMSISTTSTTTNAAQKMTTTESSDDGQQQIFSHYNRFIMFEAGLEKLTVAFSNSSSCNAVKLKQISTAKNKDPAASNTNISSNDNLLNEQQAAVIDIPSKPIGSSTVKGEIAKVWFHFASPPNRMSSGNGGQYNGNKSSNEQFTRHDWHLLSSAVPLTISWVSAIDRAVFTVGSCERSVRHRITATVAALMAKTLNDYLQAKDAQLIKPLHGNSKQLTRIFSSMARTFQEDPSIHMINVLRGALKNAFQSNGEFEAYFADRSMLPSVKDLEKGILVLLLEWKDLIHIPASSSGHNSMWMRSNVSGGGSGQQQTGKATLATTKNQIIALFEEKTRQLNLAMTNIGQQQHEHSTGGAKASSVLGDTSGRGRLFTTSAGDNESVVLSQTEGGEHETSRLLLLSESGATRGVAGTAETDVNYIRREGEGDVSSSVHTRLTASEQQQMQQENSGGKSTRTGNNGRVRANQRRVQFLSRAQARQMKDSLLALPVVRNLSTVAHSSLQGISNSYNRLRHATNRTTAASSSIPMDTFGDSTVTAGNEAMYSKLVTSAPNSPKHSTLKPAAQFAGQPLEISLNASEQQHANGVHPAEEVRINVFSADAPYDPYDSTGAGQQNGRYSSYSNYGDKKDLYWWMVKQQDYMKNVANNLASTFRDYTATTSKPTTNVNTASPNVHYYSFGDQQNNSLEPLTGAEKAGESFATPYHHRHDHQHRHQQPVDVDDVSLLELNEQQTMGQKETPAAAGGGESSAKGMKTGDEEGAANAAADVLKSSSPDGEVCLIFEPLIKILGLENAFDFEKLTSADFGLLGTKILLSVNVRQLCIDIDEADTDMNRNMFTLSKMNQILGATGSASIHYQSENLAAFVCDNLTIETVLLKKASLHSNDLVLNNLKEFENYSKIGLSNLSTNVAHILQDLKKTNQNDHHSADHQNNLLNLDTAFIVGFGVYLGQVTQRINLPLLRLVHQFSAMYENVVQTRFEMRSNRTEYTQNNDLDSRNRSSGKEDEGDEYSLNSLSTVTSVSSDDDDDSLTYSAVMGNKGDEDKKEECIITIESPPGESAQNNEQTAVSGDNATTSAEQLTHVEKCWRTVYFLLDQHRRNRVQMYLNSSSAFASSSGKSVNPQMLGPQENAADVNNNFSQNNATVYVMYPNLDLFGGCPVIIAGSGLIKRMNLVAMLSTLKLDGDLTNFGFSIALQDSSRRERPKAPANRVTFSPVVHLKNTLSASIDVDLEKTKISLYEDTLLLSALLSQQQEPSTSTSSATGQQLVVEMVIGKSSLGLNQNESEREFAPTLEQLSNYDTSTTAAAYQFSNSLGNNEAADYGGRTTDRRSAGRNSNRKYTNSARVVIGAIEIDIPQHPVALHGMMTRSGRQLSTTLQELRSSRQPSRLSRQQTMTTSNTGNNIGVDGVPPSPMAGAGPATTASMSTSTHSTGQPKQSADFASSNGPAPLPTTPKVIINTGNSSRVGRQQQTQYGDVHSNTKFVTAPPEAVEETEQKLLLPFLIDFSVILESFTIKASLLPSLRAQYRIGQVTSSGFTGSKAKFTIDVNHHSLCFNTKIQPCLNVDVNLPTEASIILPGIHINAEYLEESTTKKSIAAAAASTLGGLSSTANNATSGRSESFSADGIVFRKGSYLNMVAEIGAFEHCLTTDLLNHLLFVQKVFMKEVNEVLQKMSRSDADNTAAFLFLQDSCGKSDYGDDGGLFDMDRLGKQLNQSTSRVILFSLHLRMTGIQITATTPTNSAVRFETGAIDLHLSNRVMNVNSKRELNLKLFLRVQLDFNLALGQLIQNAMFEEAEPDFQQLAYFKTRINARNALKDEMLSVDIAEPVDGFDNEEDKEVVLITLTRPLVYVQPLALDKAVLVWLNYKNAYEYWNEQRSNLNSEVIQATQAVIDRVSQPLTQSISMLGGTSNSSSQHQQSSLGTLFLQLNVNDFGICLPISSSVINYPNQTRIFDSDLKDALVLTLESTRISACSRGSLVSKAQFNNLCIRFADDFETNLDDWKPNLADASIKNLCIVSEGTYEICSRTITHQSHSGLKTDFQLGGGSSLPPEAKAHMPASDEESVADAKWILNVSWKMDGFDIHVDTSIGKHISALFKTMTAIAGDEDDEDEEDDDEDEDEENGEAEVENMIQDEVDGETKIKEGDFLQSNPLSGARPKTLFTSRSIDDSVSRPSRLLTSFDGDDSGSSSKRWSALVPGDENPEATSSTVVRKSRSTTLKEAHRQRQRNIEKELNEQAKVITDLQQLGASNQTIQQEMQRYQELEAAAFNNFRRGVIKKLKRPSKHSNDKATMKPDASSFAKTRTYSTSLYSYDEAKLGPTTSTTSGQMEHEGHESQKGPPLGKTIRSSTISIPHLKMYDDNSSLVTLSSGDETADSYTGSPHSVDVAGESAFNFPTKASAPSTPLTEHLPKFSGAQSASSGQQQPPAAGVSGALPNSNLEPKIDFELDVKIFFNSGKCVLHTKDQQTKDAEAAMNAARNFSATDMAANAAAVAAAAAAATNSSSVSPTLAFGPANNATAAQTNKPISLLPTSIIKSRSANKLSKFYGYGQNAYRHHQPSAGMNPDFTVFLIPGLDIKLHYTSKSISTAGEEDKESKEQAHFKNPAVPLERKAPKETGSGSNSLSRQKTTKKAFLFAWITLSSIPDEIFISPHILDFFEEALKPIPTSTYMSGPASKNATLSSLQSHQAHGRHNSAGSAGSSRVSLGDSPGAQYVYYASFPVDVMVFFHFQPTIIRLGCLPVSRVECLLHLPSIDLVMSSKRSEFEPDLSSTTDSPSTPQQQQSSKTLKNMSKSFSTDSNAGGNTGVATGGGLSITGCLADFSLYIFHPYGGQKNKPTGTSSLMDKSTSKPGGSYSTSDRKDSLSLQVEFVKINISRSRKVILGESLTQSISFSAICDIGTATFKYDVRRLNEILAFPKAWYRKSIWKKIFIGENATVNAIFSDDEDALDGLEDAQGTRRMSVGKRGKGNAKDRGGDDYHLNDNSSCSSSSTTSLEFSLDSSAELKKSAAKAKAAAGAKRRRLKKMSHMIAIVNNPWETLVLLTVNFSNLNISMNMGNVMGNANWLTRNLMCDGSISIDSSGHRKFRFGIGLKNSTLDAKGGIVGGIVELSDIRTEINVREDRDREPQHLVNISLHTIENRIDYMGTSILMVRISDLKASFHDEWRLMTANVGFEGQRQQPPTSPLPTKRPASIYMHGLLKWDQMQVLMSKSTSPDFAKIIAKLEEFFTQQFHSGKRVFDSLHPSTRKDGSSGGANSGGSGHRDSMRSKSAKRTHSLSSSNSSNINQQQQKSQQSDHDASSASSTPARTATVETVPEQPEQPVVSHHRHWQRALQFVTGVYHHSITDPPCLLSMSTSPYHPHPQQSQQQQHGIILGGTIEVCAQNISLACFYGINFRSKSWAVFSLKQPSITYMTEAQHVRALEEEKKVKDGNTKDEEKDQENDLLDEATAAFSTHVVQNLSLKLGRSHGRGSHGEAENEHLNPTAAASSGADSASRTMATVCKISRAVVFPPQFRQLHEWFHYAFSPVEIDEVGRFPLPSPENVEFDAYGVPIESLTSTPSQLRSQISQSGLGTSSDRRTKSASEFHYKEEMIFAFPSMQLELKTEHLQGPEEPLMTAEGKPQVLCSFVSDFDDHIYVAVDAEAYFFLHDLIHSYINESTSTGGSSSATKDAEKEDEGAKRKVSKNSQSDKGKGDADGQQQQKQSSGKDSKALALTEKKKSEDDLSKDYREFICKVWHLEPTVRLHSWASKNIDPYGVDYILQRLGFSQARTTIPKWIQRSTMDGIDKVLSVFVYRMILKSQEDNPKTPLQLTNSGQKE